MKINEILRTLSFFKLLNKSEFQTAFCELSHVRHEENGLIYSEGDDTDAVYIVLSGYVELSKSLDYKKDIVVSKRGPGDFFGAEGIVGDTTRSCTSVAATDAELLRYPKASFLNLLENNSAVAFHFLQTLTKKIKQHNEEMARARGTTYFDNVHIVCRGEKCLSCRACELACSVSKSQSGQLQTAILEEKPPIRRIHVKSIEQTSSPTFRQIHCVHCVDAPCLTSCKLRAIRKDVFSDTVIIDSNKCVGCARCAKFCPFDAITMVASPRNKKRKIALKCTYCQERPSGPACVRACPTNALVVSLGNI